MLHLRNFIPLLFLAIVGSCKRYSVETEPLGLGSNARYAVTSYIIPDKIFLKEDAGDIIVSLGTSQPIISESSNPILFKTIAVAHGETGELFKTSTPSRSLSYGVSKIQILKDEIDISNRVNIYYQNFLCETKQGCKEGNEVVFGLVSQLDDSQLFWCPTVFYLKNITLKGVQVIITLSDGKVVKSY